MDPSIIRKVEELTLRAQACAGEMAGLQRGIDAFKDMETHDLAGARAVKKRVGLLRDLALKMIEHGQYTRRLADLVEPKLDEAIEILEKHKES